MADERGRREPTEQLDGAAPPWGCYRTGHSSYELAQYAQTGSGLLGGWSYTTSGGYFDPTSRRAAEAEAWEDYRLHRHRPAWAQLPSRPAPPPRVRPAAHRPHPRPFSPRHHHTVA